MTTAIAAVVQAAELATAGQTAAAAATRNAHAIGTLAVGASSPPGSPAVSDPPTAAQGAYGG